MMKRTIRCHECNTYECAMLYPNGIPAHLRFDVSNESNWNLTIETATNYGSTNVLMNNAGIQHIASITDTTIEVTDSQAQ